MALNSLPEDQFIKVNLGMAKICEDAPGEGLVGI